MRSRSSGLSEKVACCYSGKRRGEACASRRWGQGLRGPIGAGGRAAVRSQERATANSRPPPNQLFGLRLGRRR